MTGYDHTKPPSELTEKIKTGSNDGFKKIKSKSTAVFITNVTAKESNGSYQSGQVILIQVVFSEKVYVENPKLYIDTGGGGFSAAIMNQGLQQYSCFQIHYWQQ